MPQRLAQLQHWLGDQLHLEYHSIAASADASFRRYFRIERDHDTLIVMDAPPEQENCRPFIRVAAALSAARINAPRVLEADLEQGFLLLTDLGSRPYLGELNAATVGPLYGDALESLARMQGVELELPPYDERLLNREMALFRDWLLGHHLEMEVGEGSAALLDESFAALSAAALEQPRVFVHRDYHSRNLMVRPSDSPADPNPGVLDFQDAVLGPATYDLVSLLRDCYIAWPREEVERWALGFRERGVERGVALGGADGFMRHFDLMGVQRHLKAAGIFARLLHRDGKEGYLKDIPRTLRYIVECAPRHPEITELGRFIAHHVLPRLQEALRRALAEGVPKDAIPAESSPGNRSPHPATPPTDRP